MTTLPKTGITIAANERRHVNYVTSAATPLPQLSCCRTWLSGAAHQDWVDQGRAQMLQAQKKKQNPGWKSGGDLLFQKQGNQVLTNLTSPPILYQELIASSLPICFPMPQCQPSCSSSWSALSFSDGKLGACIVSLIRYFNWFTWTH